MSFWQLSPASVVEVVDDEVVVDVVYGGMQHPFTSHVQSMFEEYLSLQSWAVTQITFFVQFPATMGHMQQEPYLM